MMRDLAEWDLLEVIGEGAHAVVHRAVHPDQPGRVVAVKRLRDVDATGVDGLQDEARVLADLDHPAITTLLEVVTDGEGVALVLALATGGTLARRLRDRGALPPAEVVDLGRRLGSALHAAHAVGVLHRDVAPSNVWYGREDEPRLGDFGMAAAVDVPPDEVVGTPTYLDPDVAHGAPPGPASDTWSLGVLLWECLAGQPPWGGEDDAAVLRAADRADHPPLDAFAPDAPPDLVAVLERAIARDVGQRFAHPQALELALARVDLSGTVDAASDADATEPVGTSGIGAVASAVADEQARTGPPDHADTGHADGPAGVPADDPVVADREPDEAADEPERTTVFGARPTVDRPAEEPLSSRTRWLGVVAVVVPVAVAAWVLVTAFGPRVDAPGPVAVAASTSPGTSPPSSSPSGAATVATSGPTPPPAAAPGSIGSPSPTSPTSTAPGTAEVATSDPAGSSEPTATPSRGPAPAPTGAPPTPTPTVSAPAVPDPLPGWTRRTPAPPCPQDRVPVVLPAGSRRLRADVDGSGCTWTLLVGPREVADTGRRTVLTVPDAAGVVAGSYDLGPAGEVVEVGDWDGDGIDTIAVVRTASATVFTFPSWDALDGEPVAGPTRRAVVATAPDGRDRIVDAARLPD